MGTERAQSLLLRKQGETDISPQNTFPRNSCYILLLPAEGDPIHFPSSETAQSSLSGTLQEEYKSHLALAQYCTEAWLLVFYTYVWMREIVLRPGMQWQI